MNRAPLIVLLLLSDSVWVSHCLRSFWDRISQSFNKVFPVNMRVVFQFQVFESLEETQDTGTCYQECTPPVSADGIPKEPKSPRFVIHDHWEHPGVVCLSRPIYVFKSLVIHSGGGCRC